MCAQAEHGLVSLRRSARTIAFTLGLGALRTIVIKSVGYQVLLNGIACLLQVARVTTEDNVVAIGRST